MEFSYVYILLSQADAERFYVGLTDDLKDRLRRHNSGQVPSPPNFVPGASKLQLRLRTKTAPPILSVISKILLAERSPSSGSDRLVLLRGKQKTPRRRLKVSGAGVAAAQAADPQSQQQHRRRRLRDEGEVMYERFGCADRSGHLYPDGSYWSSKRGEPDETKGIWARGSCGKRAKARPAGEQRKAVRFSGKTSIRFEIGAARERVRRQGHLQGVCVELAIIGEEHNHAGHADH